MAGTTTSDLLLDCTAGTSNQITYTATPTTVFNCTARISYICQTNDKSLEFGFYVNSTLQSNYITKVRYDTTSIVNNDVCTVNALLSLAQNDTLEVWCQNTSGGADIDVNEMSVIIVAID